MHPLLPILADLPPPDSPQAVGWIVIIITGLLMGLYYGLCVYKMIWGKPKPTAPQPFVVEANKEYATKPELHGLSQRMDDELGRERGARKKIHEEIAEIQSDISSLKTETDKQSADLTEMKADIKEVAAVTSETSGKIELMNQQLQQVNQHLLNRNSSKPQS